MVQFLNKNNLVSGSNNAINNQVGISSAIYFPSYQLKQILGKQACAVGRNCRKTATLWLNKKLLTIPIKGRVNLIVDDNKKKPRLDKKSKNGHLCQTFCDTLISRNVENRLLVLLLFVHERIVDGIASRVHPRRYRVPTG